MTWIASDCHAFNDGKFAMSVDRLLCRSHHIVQLIRRVSATLNPWPDFEPSNEALLYPHCSNNKAHLGLVELAELLGRIAAERLIAADRRDLTGVAPAA